MIKGRRVVAGSTAAPDNGNTWREATPMNVAEMYERLRELRERFEASESPGEALAAEFEALAGEAEGVEQPGVEVLARKAERYASNIRTGFPPLEE